MRFSGLLGRRVRRKGGLDARGAHTHAAISGTTQLTADLVLTNQPGTVFMRWERRGGPIAALLMFSGRGRNKGS